MFSVENNTFTRIYDAFGNIVALIDKGVDNIQEQHRVYRVDENQGKLTVQKLNLVLDDEEHEYYMSSYRGYLAEINALIDKSDSQYFSSALHAINDYLYEEVILPLIAHADAKELPINTI